MTEPVQPTEEVATAPPRPPAQAREVAAILAIVVTLFAVALAAVWPWRAGDAAGSATLDRYAPTSDGWSSLSVKQDADGHTLLWQSANRRHLLNAAAYALEITPAQRAAIESLYAKAGTAPSEDFVALVAGAQLIHERVTELDASGVYTQTLNLRLRNTEGEFIVSLNADAPDQEVIFAPPLPALPAMLAAGERWEGAGQIGAQAAYTFTGEVAGADPYRGPLGESDDCLLARVRFVISVGGQTVDDRQWTDTYCAGVGLAHEEEIAAATGAVTRWVTLSANGANGAAEGLPAMADAPRAPQLAPRDQWRLTRVGRYASGIDTAATIAPVYLPRPPALLVASHDGDLIALDVSVGFSDPLWRFSPGGTVYGQPAVDPAGGRIYFGASDKRLYALDSRGLFLWAFLTGDNVATRPIIFGDLVIFGSEDRNVYAVEAAGGRLRWQQETGAAVAASPALAPLDDGRTAVVIGSDDGVAYALDAATGEPLWTYEAGKPIEAPLLVADGRVLVTSTGGTVAALDPATGEEQWVADANGRPIRYAPAVAADRLAVVDEQGYLSAYSLADGRRLWQSLEADYLGAPLLVGDRLYVTGTGAVIHEVNLDGVRAGVWRMADAGDAIDTAPRLDFGPVAGGGALWTVDSRSVARRMGGEVDGPAHLRLDWVRQVNEPPFAMDILRAAPILWGDVALAVDEGGRVVEVDPRTGALRLRFQANVEAARLEPVIAGDLLLLTNAGGLAAVRLDDGSVAWQAAGGTTVRPPVVAGDAVLWSAALPDGSGARLVALDALTGAPRWTRDFAGVAIPSGVATTDGSAYISAPVSRLDLASGETVWEAAELTGGTGSPALSPDGRVLYVGRLDPATGGEVIALNADDGAILWRSALGQTTLNLLDRPWLDGDVLLIPTLSGSALGLDAATGEVRWQAALPAPRFGAITVADEQAVMALTDGQVVALSTQDGRIVSRGGDREGGLEGYAFAQRPLLVGGRLIVAFGSSLRSYIPAEAAP